jgi:NADH-quinone oxidoreductase subunit N
MTAPNLIMLSPLIVLAITSVLVMLVIAFYRNHLLTMLLTLLGLAAAFICVSFLSTEETPQVTPLLVFDGYCRFYMGLLFAANFVIVLLSYSYLERRRGNREELYVLLILATLGSSVLAASTHFASFFLGLELLSVSLYTLIAYLRYSRLGLEAGIKYLILAATSSAFLLFGMALIYAEMGSLEFPFLATGIANFEMNALPVIIGFTLIIVGIGFKLGVVPFHMWTPDVYQGAPAPVTAFIASVSKGGIFALLIRLFMELDVYEHKSLILIFTIIAIVSMFVGNLLALMQNNVKRILAYSSIAHMGYLLVAFLAGGSAGIEAATLYWVIYFITIIGAFGVVGILSETETEAEELEDYRSLMWRRPGITFFFTTVLFSLASIPLTAGFIGKYYIFAAGVKSSLWTLVIIMVVNSAIGLYYYLRIIVVMYMYPTKEMEVFSAAPSPLSLVGNLTLAALTVLLFWLGVYPTPVIEIIRTMVTRFI